MRVSTLRKLRGGCYAVTLCLPPDLAAFAKKEFRGRGFVDADQFLSCLLNTALFEAMEADPPPPLVGFDGMDDDIPF
ncbi:hypothetical protein [Hydrogenophaga sp. H7]|uniref:hypothetical protein n=1 Tax=Hydrogenophaga sp. H7 TaxID=1882399 RepID=UPI0009A470F8|nr:hypothetical protein [Hydrogenophaga sp. H7]OPF64403.1 hypothetical protein BC358_06100 [Hydrogenophaga sp. H7]